MSLLNPRYKAEHLYSHGGLMIDVMTALLTVFTATLVLLHVTEAMGVAPATDLDFICLAYS